MAVAAVSSCKKLQTISIPASLKLVTENAENPAERSECIFNKDTALQKVEVASENPWYQADENALYSKEGRNLIYWFSGGTQTDVKISEDVRCIEPQAFLGNSIVESISVPDQVREIGRDAFKNCYSLAKLTLPETLDYCGDNTFAGCESLAELHLPEGIEDLGNRIAGCLSLKKVYFPNSLKELTGGIQECDALEEVVISEDNPYLEADSMGCYSKGKEKLFYVFHASDLEEFIAPESLKEIGDGVFNSAYALKSVELKNVERIGKSAFEGCGDLQNVNFGSRIKNIGQSAFGNCTGLTGITLPGGMELIETNAFYGCTALNKVEFQGTVQKIEGNAFGYCTSLESFDVPEGIEYMDSILEDCEMLTKVTLSSTVRGFCYGEELDTEPFYNMNALQQIGVASGNPYLKTDGTALYTADGKILLYHCIGADQESYDVEQGTEVIGEGAFKGSMFSSTVPALKEITLPDSLKEIRAGAFENAGLQQIVIPDSVQTIGDRAFSRCIYLSQVEIGKDSSLQEIGMEAFQNCRSMEVFYIPAAVKKLGDSVFNLSDGLSEISYGGTKEEWKSLVPSYSSLGGNIQVTSIICSDGTVTPEDMGE